MLSLQRSMLEKYKEGTYIDIYRFVKQIVSSGNVSVTRLLSHLTNTRQVIDDADL